jgi:hypothetical protein
VRDNAYFLHKVQSKIVGVGAVAELRQDNCQISVVNVAGPLDGSVGVLCIAFHEAAEDICEVGATNIERLGQYIRCRKVWEGNLQTQTPEKCLQTVYCQCRHVFRIISC